MIEKEQEIKASLEGICERLNIPGHLFLYLEGEKIRFVGNLSFSALMPILIEWMTRKK